VNGRKMTKDKHRLETRTVYFYFYKEKLLCVADITMNLKYCYQKQQLLIKYSFSQ